MNGSVTSPFISSETEILETRLTNCTPSREIPMASSWVHNPFKLSVLPTTHFGLLSWGLELCCYSLRTVGKFYGVRNLCINLSILESQLIPFSLVSHQPGAGHTVSYSCLPLFAGYSHLMSHRYSTPNIWMRSILI